MLARIYRLDNVYDSKDTNLEASLDYYLLAYKHGYKSALNEVRDDAELSNRLKASFKIIK